MLCVAYGELCCYISVICLVSMMDLMLICLNYASCIPNCNIMSVVEYYAKVAV